MTTKKEKRAAGEARAEIQRATSIESGLQALKSDRDARARRAEQIKRAADEASKKVEKALVNRKMQRAMALASFNVDVDQELSLHASGS